jgi:hypothetical protein
MEQDAVLRVLWSDIDDQGGENGPLWLLGVPIPVILLLWLFFGR